MVNFYIHFSDIIFYLCCHGLFLAAFQVMKSHGEVVIQVYETDSGGKVLLNETGHTNCTFKSLRPQQKEHYVSFNENNSLVILRPLDLEVLSLQNNSSKVSVVYVCGHSEKTVTIDIIPVNEFSPIFTNAPYIRYIKEGDVKGSEVIDLGNRWQDGDKVKYNTVTAFRLYPYVISAFDGRDHFHLNETTGKLTTTTVFDYENMPYRKIFLLNISVEDDGGRSSFSTVNVTVQDVDDNSPMFTRCKDDVSSQCRVTAYTSTIDRFFQGTLSVSPKSIYAKDKDMGIDARILYEIDGIDDMAANIRIDNYTGEVEVIEPFTNLTNWTNTEILNTSLHVIATEQSANSHRTNITLTVYVYREFPTTTSIPTTSQDPTLTTSDGHATEKPTSQLDVLLLIEIIVPIVVVVALVIIVVCFICKRKKRQEDTRYMVRESQRVENVRKSENFEHKNIDVISSTPINPYELISMYARMDSNEKNEDSPGSNKTENAEDRTDNGESQVDEETLEETDEKLDRLYTKVDKRKQRKRQIQALEFMNIAPVITEDINEEESDGSGSGANANHTTDAIESVTESHTELYSNGEQQVYENHAEESIESPVTSTMETDTYKDYDNVELF